MGRTAATVAILGLLLLVVGPVGRMVWESLHIDQVETIDGRRYRGQIKDSDGRGVMLRVREETTSREFPRAEVRSEGRVPSLDQYRGVLGGRNERNMLLATLALAGASTLLAFLIGLPLGILLAAYDLPGRRAWETLFTLPLVLPPVLLAIATYRDLLPVRPEFLRAVLVFGLSLFPLVSLMTARAVRALGADALDAARVQAAPGEVLGRILLGPALPGAAAGALLVFAFVVADFAVPDFLGVTTAQNTITVYANAVFRAWSNDGNAGAATAASMPPTLFALVAFALVLRIEARRSAQTLGSAFREFEPLPLGRKRPLAVLLLLALLLLSLLWPMARHLEIAAGKHFGSPAASAGAAAAQITPDASRARPASLADGLRKGLAHDRVGESTKKSLLLAGGGALLAVVLALLLTEAGRRNRALDRVLLVLAFLPVAVPPMALAVGWVSLFGPRFCAMRYAPILLLGARLLPFATFAVRAARQRVDDQLLDAGTMAGLGPMSRAVRVTLPLVAPGAAVGFLLAFLFGLREVDAIVFTRTGSETLPVQLYNMIHYGYDVQVGGLAFLWTAGVGLLLLLLLLLGGSRLRLTP